MIHVTQKTLMIIAGMLWTAVGIMLVKIATTWIGLIPAHFLYLSLSLGVLLGVLNGFFGFSKIAKKNISRIEGLNSKASVFAFQRIQSYFLIIFMIALGIFMRHSSFIPKWSLLVIYFTAGIGLFLASFQYYKVVLKKE